MVIAELYKQLQQYKAVMELNNGCTENVIQLFQQQNNIRLPRPLIELLICFDGGEIFVPGTIIFGIGESNKVDLKTANSKKKRSVFKIPNNYLIFAKVNYGDLLCINLNEEHEVIQWDHELDEEFCKWESLEEWLEDSINNYE